MCRSEDNSVSLLYSYMYVRSGVGVTRHAQQALFPLRYLADLSLSSL